MRFKLMYLCISQFLIKMMKKEDIRPRHLVARHIEAILILFLSLFSYLHDNTLMLLSMQALFRIIREHFLCLAYLENCGIQRSLFDFHWIYLLFQRLLFYLVRLPNCFIVCLCIDERFSLPAIIIIFR